LNFLYENAMKEIKTNFEIRQAEEEDVPEILELIKSLADFEHLSDQVVATEKLLKKTLFGRNSPAEVQIAFEKNVTLGFALYFRTFSTFLGRPGIYLEDLYVRKSARGKGVGKALLSRLAQRSLEIGGGRLEWSVLDWNESAINFYKKMGAFPLDEWTMFRLTGSKLKELAEENL